MCVCVCVRVCARVCGWVLAGVLKWECGAVPLYVRVRFLLTHARVYRCTYSVLFDTTVEMGTRALNGRYWATESGSEGLGGRKRHQNGKEARGFRVW